nr:Hsp20 family protein [Myxococcus sp. RHSTA-1-4]
MQDNCLTVRGGRDAEKQEPHDTWYSHQHSLGSFMLTLRVPKRHQAPPRRIAVKSTRDAHEKAKA